VTPASFNWLSWARPYRIGNLSGDLIAGIIVATVLVPQAMAYALLAGMPPVTGIYACILPVLIYALLGTSNYLAIGPVAIVSLMVADIAGKLALPGSPEYQAIAINLALLAGVVLIIFGLCRFGALVNFLSHAVITGFINAAALLIAASQLPYLLGIEIRKSGFFITVGQVFDTITETNIHTAVISVVAVIILLATGRIAGKLPQGHKHTFIYIVSRTGPLLVVVLSCLLVYSLSIHEQGGVDIVGSIPAGLPPVSISHYAPGLWSELAPAAVLIALVSYLSSISIAR